jgi:NitT/TauT family transport system substrate-binding protein
MHRRSNQAAGILCAVSLLLLSACQAAAESPRPAHVQAAAGPTAAPAGAAPPAASAPTATPAETARLPERTRLAAGATTGVAFPLYIGLERGYFTEIGIDLELEHILSGSQLVGHLTTGDVDLGLGGVAPGFFNAFARGLPIKVILDLSHFAPDGKSHMILARQDLYDSGQLRGVEQLKGRRVAMSSIPSGIMIDTDRALQRVGLSVDDTELVQIPFPDMPGALANGSVDAAAMFDPMASRATERNVATPIRYLAEDYPNHQIAWTVMSTRLAEQPAVVGAFAVAYLRAARDYERARRFGTDVETVAVAIARHSRQEPAQVAALLPAGRMTASNPDGRVSVESLQSDLDWYRQRGYVDRDLNLADFVDHQYADYAARLLGPFR